MTTPLRVRALCDQGPMATLNRQVESPAYSNRRGVMNRPTVVALLGTILIAASATGFAQNARPAPAIASSDVLSQISMFSYREGKKSSLNFRGTPIAANANGAASVKYEDGNADISAKVSDLPAPGTLGPYTTYVLWTLTPDGHAVNQGVIGSYEGGKGEITTNSGASRSSSNCRTERSGDSSLKRYGRGVAG